MEYVKIENGIIIEHICTNIQPSGNGWKQVRDFFGHIGMREDFIDWGTGVPLSLEELATKGLVVDRRGTYWDKNTKRQHEIKRIGQEPDDAWTDIEPPDIEKDRLEYLYAKWDEEANAWVVDQEAMLEHVKKEIRERRDLLLQDSDWTQVQDAPVDGALWREYRQDLRDLPQQVGFPYEVIWPVPPSDS